MDDQGTGHVLSAVEHRPVDVERAQRRPRIAGDSLVKLRCGHAPELCERPLSPAGRHLADFAFDAQNDLAKFFAGRAGRRDLLQ